MISEFWIAKFHLESIKLDKNGMVELKVCDDGHIHQLQIILQTITNGPGKLIGVGSGDPSCHESDFGPRSFLVQGTGSLVSPDLSRLRKPKRDRFGKMVSVHNR